MDVQFTPNATSLSVGEELRCSARGNPRPDMELSPATLAKEQKSGEGWRSLVVQADWVGRTLTVECTASNGVDGELYSLTNSVTFNVTGDSTDSSIICPPRDRKKEPIFFCVQLFGRPFVKRFALCYRTVVLSCPVCL